MFKGYSKGLLPSLVLPACWIPVVAGEFFRPILDLRNTGIRFREGQSYPHEC